MRLEKCKNGHYYDGDTYQSCPECSKRAKDTPQQIVRCPKGHVYDRRQYSSCPECSKQANTANFVKCPNGHVYDARKNSSCPECSKQASSASFVRCPKGHVYDPKKYSACPECEKEKHFRKCPKGHVYDATKNSSCPECSKQTNTASFVKCPNGHVYDTRKHTACPECAKTNDEAGSSLRPVAGWLVDGQGRDHRLIYGLSVITGIDAAPAVPGGSWKSPGEDGAYRLGLVGVKGSSKLFSLAYDERKQEHRIIPAEDVLLKVNGQSVSGVILLKDRDEIEVEGVKLCFVSYIPKGERKG